MTVIDQPWFLLAGTALCLAIVVFTVGYVAGNAAQAAEWVRKAAPAHRTATHHGGRFYYTLPEAEYVDLMRHANAAWTDTITEAHRSNGRLVDLALADGTVVPECWWDPAPEAGPGWVTLHRLTDTVVPVLEARRPTSWITHVRWCTNPRTGAVRTTLRHLGDGPAYQTATLDAHEAVAADRAGEAARRTNAEVRSALRDMGVRAQDIVHVDVGLGLNESAVTTHQAAAMFQYRRIGHDEHPDTSVAGSAAPIQRLVSSPNDGVPQRFRVDPNFPDPTPSPDKDTPS